MGVLGLMRALRLRGFVRAFTRGRIQQRLRYAVLAVAGVVVFLAVFAFSLLGMGALLRLGEGPAALALAGVYTVAAFALVFVGLAAALYTMYLSEDLEVLSSMPIKERTIFAYKFWETLISNSSLFGVLALPIILSYGVAAGASPLFYPMVLLVSVLVLMIPTGLCVVLTMPLMRVLPAGKAKEVVGALGVLAGASLFVAQQWLLRPDRDAAPGTTSPLRAIAEAPPLNVPPGSWASDALAGAASLEWGRMLGGLAPLLALAVGVYALCLSLTGWAYATGRARAAESGGRVRSSSGWIERLLSPLPRDVRAVAVKDLISLPRDLRRLAFMLFPVAMTVPAFLFGPDLPATIGSAGGPLLLVPHLGVSALAAMISFQGGSQTVSIEGRSYWFFAASPLSPRRLLWGKVVAAFFVGAVVALLGTLCVTVFMGLYPPGLLLGLAVGLAGSAVASLYSVGISALMPRFDWENPMQAAPPAAGILMLLCLAGLALSAGLLVVLALRARDLAPVWACLGVATMLWTVVAVVPGYAVFAAGARRLRRMDWEL